MRFRGGRTTLAAGLLLLAFGSGIGIAQSTTGTLRGNVTDETGGVLPGATVDAKNTDTGFDRSAVTAGNGFYNISVQPGPYTVTVTLPSFRTETHNVRVLLGETQALDFRMVLEARSSQAVTVTAEAPIIETKTNEIATNVTEEQIRLLPQDSRNFLQFANLAPGVRTSTDENNKEVQGGALPGFNTNVFIDGTSYKNDIINGGIVGQDSSRGNPFPQNAVQEFRVITQNFKAEYEKSSSAIITAVTKSGGNDFHGDGFAEYQDKSLVAADDCARFDRCTRAPRSDNFVKPDYTRWQAGVSIGGPIIRDRLHFFASWEYNDQQRSKIVSFGGQAGQLPANVFNELQGLTGTVPSPFKENLVFGKMSWQAAPSDIVDFTGFYRHENEVKDVGDQRAFEAGTDIINAVWNAQAKNSLLSSKFLNETTIGYQDYKWNPSSVVPGIVGRDYQGALRVGSSENLQNIHQKRFSIRDDFTLLDLHGFGDHVVKVGAVFNANTYDVQKSFNIIPTYRYRSDVPAGMPFAIPFEASIGFGNPDVSLDNNQYGVYVQDDWSITPRLTANVGLRWDYETNGLDNNFVTSPLVRSELESKFPSYFFTDGSDRPAYKNAFQPRVGFAYDLSGKGTTVLFAGYGRYVDRVEYNALLDEKARLQYTTLTFEFSADGQPRCGNPSDPTTCRATIMWNDSYLTAAGLQSILNGPNPPKPEAFLINNNTKPPVSDQFTAGVRQQLGAVGVALSYAGVRSRNGYTYVWGDVGGHCCTSPSPEFRNVLLSSASKRAWYDALFLQVDKAYTASSKWGATLAYTYGHATRTGGDNFSLDFPTPSDYPRSRAAQDERHRVVLSGIVGLPWSVQLSTLVQVGTGVGFDKNDCSAGFDNCHLKLGDGTQPGTLPFQSWDLGLQKDFYFTQSARVGVRGQVFNLTNHNNYGCFEGFIRPSNDPAGPNPNFATPNCLITQPRRFQFGVSLGF